MCVTCSKCCVPGFSVLIVNRHIGVFQFLLPDGSETCVCDLYECYIALQARTVSLEGWLKRLGSSRGIEGLVPDY